MESDAHRWDEKYRASTIHALRAEPLLSRHIARIRHLSGSRTALDLAAGRCHVSVYLATEGLSVTALDCSAVGLDLGLDAPESGQRLEARGVGRRGGGLRGRLEIEHYETSESGASTTS